MKRPWVWALVVGLLVGGAAGFGLARGTRPWPAEGRTGPAGPVLDRVDFLRAAAAAGPAGWTPVPPEPEFRAGEASAAAVPLSGLRGRRSADELTARTRRLVARADLPAADRGAFFRRFTEAVADGIRAAGGVTGAGGTGEAPAGGAPAGPRVYWSYQHYAVGTTAEAGGLAGVAQAWLVGDGPTATLIVTITEAEYEAK